MEKIGRNERCPCGSGLKYKKCHGRESVPISKPAMTVTQSPTIRFEPLGFPGQNGHIVTEPRFSVGDPRNEGGPDGSPGDYDVIFTLARQGWAIGSERSIVPAAQLVGDSHLQAPGRFEIEAECEGEKFRFVGAKNERGFLSSISVKCQANPARCVLKVL